MRTWKYMTVAVWVLAAATVCRADRFVSTNGLHQNNFTNWTDAATNVQDAIDAAASGETIWVTNGHYVCTSPVSVSAGTTSSSLTMISLTKSLTLKSVEGPDVTILDANGSAGSQQRVIFVTGGSSTVDGFTITGGYINQADNPTWPHYRGGGILRRDGGVLVTNCVITANFCSSSGSGIALLYSGTARDCIVSNNTGSAGVYLRQGGVVLDCEIVDNATGVYLNESGRIERCSVFGNGVYGSSVGSGVYMSNGGTVRNSLIRDNVGKRGGGVYMYYGAGMKPVVQNCTITKNSVNSAGGGIYFSGTGTEGSMENTIVYGNSGYGSPSSAVADADVASGGLTAAHNYSPYDFTPYGVGNIIGSNPQFVDAGANDYRIQLTSPCVNKGTNATWITGSTLDLEGNARIHGAYVDIGAYEATPKGTMITVR